MKRRSSGINRDLNPTAEAVAAMYLYGRRYSEQNLGSMGFWDSLSPGDQRTCVELVDRIVHLRNHRSRVKSTTYRQHAAATSGEGTRRE